nr:DUF5103 domain-containing protein [Bacteroidota bacterium]
MRKILYLVILLFPFTGIIYSAVAQDDYYNQDYIRNADYVYKDNIKTVLLYKEGFELSAPLVQLNSTDKLVFSFDDLDGDYKKYEYTIVHCDANWNESDLMPNEYLESFTDDYIDDYQYSVNTMQTYTHYEKTIPNNVIMYRFSGNYLLKVYIEDDPENVVFTKRFFVVDPKVTVAARVRMPANINDRNRNSKQEVRFTIQTGGSPVADPYREISVTVQQNGRWDNAITDLQPRLVSGSELIYDHDGINVFDGGSDFRYFDMKSLRYNSFRVQSIEYSQKDGYQVYLHPDQVKRKNVYQSIQENINGRFLIKSEDMPVSATESEYATVHFFLPYDTPLVEGKLYLFGGLSYWQYLKLAELSYDYESAGFRASLFLKQGFYNYKYMMLPNDSKVGDVSFIEGNFFDTNNEYTIYVYYQPRGGRYTRLVNITSFPAHPN